MKVLVNGFKQLYEMYGRIWKFRIKCSSNQDLKSLLEAHTCFNQIDIPKFSS